jgi:hypothetical protein
VSYYPRYACKFGFSARRTLPLAVK